jgi:sulfur relay (sulfurtransferase) complex TusBCD TusD component (DsrE family)
VIRGGHEELFIVNDPPYGRERVYSALRLAHALIKREPSMQVTIFLMGFAIAVPCNSGIAARCFVVC